MGTSPKETQKYTAHHPLWNTGTDTKTDSHAATRTDRELDVQVAAQHGVGPDRHALVHDGLDIARLVDHVRVGLDHQRATIQVLDVEGETAQRLGEQDLLLDDQVGAVAVKHLVLVLLQHDDHVAGHRVGRLVGLAAKQNLLVVRRALGDKDLECAACAFTEGAERTARGEMKNDACQKTQTDEERKKGTSMMTTTSGKYS